MPHLRYTLCLLTSLVGCASQVPTPTEPDRLSPNTPLYEIITANDAAMFQAFNACDGTAFSKFLAKDLEFYHDNDGIILGPDPLITAVNTTICGNFTRQLVPGSVKVWPVPEYGAIQTGLHTFTNYGSDTPHGQGRFLHVWHQDKTGWVITRIVSYDHRAYQPSLKELE